MQTWRSLVTPWVVRHRRHSSWHLWGPHTLLLYILHICSLPTVSVIICAINCGLIIHNYLIYFHSIHFSLLFLSLFSYFHYSHFAVKVVHIQLWHCFEQWNVFSFISFNILVLCCFIPLGSTGHLVCDTAFGMQHTKFFFGGGVCVTWWSLGDI